MDFRKRLLKIEFDNTDVRESIIMAFDQLMSECIQWTVEDFEMQAQNITDDNWEEVYDKTKFQDALETMIRKHDADIGICWETINVYLDEYCRKEIVEEED